MLGYSSPVSETLGPPPSPKKVADPLLGTVIAGKYRIVSRLASGGMGTVYRAEQQALGREVALKLLHPGNMEGEDSTASRDDFSVLEKRFSREAAILAKLQHPNIVTVYDYGAIEEDPRPDADHPGRPRFYMVMELIGGRTLQQRLVERKVLPWDEAVRLFRQIARGLREAHAVGVVHRDLKPANVMIVRDRDGEEQVKLLDFGIGKILDDPGSPSLPPTGDTNPPNSEDELTRDGRFVGSPQYMSPEQVTGEGIDERSDIYSFGVMLYRCLAGKNPFHRHSVTMIMLAHLNDHPPDLATVADPEMPPWLGELVMRCLAKRKEARPQSMEEIARAFADHSLGLPASRATATPGPPSSSHGGLPPSSRTGFEPTTEMARSQAPTPHTEQPVLTPAPPEPTRSRAPLFGALVALALAVTALTAYLARKPDRDGREPATASSVKEARHFTLVLESIPAGARVLEGKTELGVTPLQLDLDNEPLGKAPRTFVIVREGHQPYTIVQGPSSQTVRVVAALVALAPTAPVASTVAPASAPDAAAPPPPSTKPEPLKPTPVKSSAPSTTPPPVDILLKR